jgi:hypothetical protein
MRATRSENSSATDLLWRTPATVASSPGKRRQCDFDQRWLLMDSALLGGEQVDAQACRLAQVDMLRRVPLIRVVMNQNANHAG